MDTKKLQRTTLIFTIWTFFYLLWFRWFMLVNWKFNIFVANDWKSIFNEWWYNGWIIQGSYFWTFVIALFLFIPVWILGFCFLSSVKYRMYYEKLFWDQIYKKKTKQIQKNNTQIRIKKKKSYREVRPRALAGTPQTVAPVQPNVSSDMMTSMPSNSQDLFLEEKMPQMPKGSSFSHRELPDNFEGDSPFASQSGDFDMSAGFDMNDTPVELKENLPEIMQNAGAQIIESPELAGNKVDYLAVSKDQVFLILTDNEKGDWLADEERFNDEDPLWFSETSHRVSPITTLKKFETTLDEQIKAAGLKMQSHVILVKTDGNIINAEDMIDIWKQMNVLVCRSATGMPEELPSFTDTFPKELEAGELENIEQIKLIVKA